MSNDKTTVVWVEPTGEQEKAGSSKITLPKSTYDLFMESEGIPIYRDIGVRRVQDLPLAPWKRLGGKGSYIQLYGTEGRWGCYVVEVPASGALHTQRHFYEAQFFVVEGRGTAEVWEEGSDRKVTVEWQKGSLFAVPLNACYRIVNATNSPALLLAGTTAPNIMNLLRDSEFVFNCPYHFRRRFDPAMGDYYREQQELEPDPLAGRAMVRTNIIPDVVHAALPLDNVRSPGYRKVEPDMAGNSFFQFLAEHQIGRYSKAHAHGSSAVLICVKGKGYTYTWPTSAGSTPWRDGKADQVKRQDYEPVGLVSAAPMGGYWLHQHFGVGKEPLRLMAWFGPYTNRTLKSGKPGQVVPNIIALDSREGGTAIPYDEEDPFIRKEFEETLRREGLESRMPAEVYEKPA